jgi:hypothetical protein
MQQVGAELGFRELIGRDAIEPGEPSDDGDVTVDGAVRIAAEGQLVDETLAKRGQTILSVKGRES